MNRCIELFSIQKLSCKGLAHTSTQLFCTIHVVRQCLFLNGTSILLLTPTHS